jgi:hypothetical protein
VLCQAQGSHILPEMIARALVQLGLCFDDFAETVRLVIEMARDVLLAAGGSQKIVQ